MKDKDDWKNGKQHPWHKMNGISKRISGFFVYQVWSYLSLFDPEMADRVMYRGLKDQFEEIQNDK